MKWLKESRYMTLKENVRQATTYRSESCLFGRPSEAKRRDADDRTCTVKLMVRLVSAMGRRWGRAW